MLLSCLAESPRLAEKLSLRQPPTETWPEKSLDIKQKLFLAAYEYFLWNLEERIYKLQIHSNIPEIDIWDQNGYVGVSHCYLACWQFMFFADYKTQRLIYFKDLCDFSINFFISQTVSQ